MTDLSASTPTTRSDYSASVTAELAGTTTLSFSKSSLSSIKNALPSAR